MATVRASGTMDGVQIKLTPRQHEVLLLLDQGFSHQQIADELGIERSTVRSYIQDCVSLLHTRGRGGHGAAYEARRRGLIP